MTLQELAEYYASQFDYKTRPNGSRIVIMRDNADDKDLLTEFVREIHGDRFPDDYIYQYIYDSLLLIGEGCDEYFCPEADIYNTELFDYVQSHASRLDAADEEIDQGNATTIIDAVQIAQANEKREIYEQVWNFLESKSEG